MNKQSFPLRRSDGSFEIDAILEDATGSSRASVQSWLDEWVIKHRVWNREWDGKAGTTVETLVLDDTFAAVPNARGEGRELHIRLFVRPQADRWRDWATRLITELADRFGLHFIRFSQ
jgi:hypothetical protein